MGWFLYDRDLHHKRVINPPHQIKGLFLINSACRRSALMALLHRCDEAFLLIAIDY